MRPASMTNAGSILYLGIGSVASALSRASFDSSFSCFKSDFASAFSTFIFAFAIFFLTVYSVLASLSLCRFCTSGSLEEVAEVVAVALTPALPDGAVTAPSAEVGLRLSQINT